MPELSLATFNAHMGLTRRGTPYDVVAVCRQLDSDVVILQESWWPDDREAFATEAARSLGYRLDMLPLARARIGRRGEPAVPRLDEAAVGTIGVALLTRLPVTRTSQLDMGRLALDSCRRAALRLDLDVDGGTFAVVGTHMSHLEQGSLIQLRRLRRQLPAADEPAALGGDMNMWGPVIVRGLPGWRRAVLGRTWPAGHPHSQIDHLLVTPPVEVVEAEVLGRTGSDHRPIRAVLRF